MNFSIFQVLDVHLVADPLTRESRGFGFITMSSIDEAENCIKYLNRSVLEGRIITVEKVKVSPSIFSKTWVVSHYYSSCSLTSNIYGISGWFVVRDLSIFASLHLKFFWQQVSCM